ncbi:MAG: PfkB family carbohydrate kinase [Kiritimatiellae bacterium]|nr:PfkB family carbohydrate kinase [Kiritimatiellia bacterium]
MRISLQRAKTLTARFRRQKILVLGDLMLDRYLYGTAHRLSPEAPVPVVRVRDERGIPGGAANVARNVKTLGAQALICGAIGNDYDGRQLLKVMQESGINTENVVVSGNAPTTVKMRVIAGHQQVVRVDWDGNHPPRAETLEKLERMAVAATAKCSGVILEDYSRGIICQRLVNAVLDAARRRKIPAALDPKSNRDLVLKDIAVIKPNRKEAFILAGMPETEPAENPLKDSALLRAVGILKKKWGAGILVITLGAQGMLVVPRGKPPFHVPTAAREVFDISGAGDSVIAALLLALNAGADCRDAAELANCAAGVVVGKFGTATCSGGELMGFIKNLRHS